MYIMQQAIASYVANCARAIKASSILIIGYENNIEFLEVVHKATRSGGK